jgi:hypothetical protein
MRNNVVMASCWCEAHTALTFQKTQWCGFPFFRLSVIDTQAMFVREFLWLKERSLCHEFKGVLAILKLYLLPDHHTPSHFSPQFKYWQDYHSCGCIGLIGTLVLPYLEEDEKVGRI